jgi:hypothetical protein
VSGAIVRVQSPEEFELARWLARVETLRGRVADLRTELETLRAVLGRFETEYHARVGIRFVELDRVRLQIAEYEGRLARLAAEAAADPERIARDIDEDLAARRAEIDAEEEEIRRFQRAYREDQAVPAPDTEDAEELRRLYRALAKRHHPDLARTDDERRRREAIMLRVNAAYHARDLVALRALAQEVEIEDPAFALRPIRERLGWAMREVERLDTLLAELAEELTAARRSETHRLWLRQEAGEGVVEALEADLGEELARGRERLAELAELFRRVVARRDAA